MANSNNFKKNSKYLINTPTGFKNFVGVQKKYVGVLFEITFEDNSSIKCSGKHAFLTKNGYTHAKDLCIGEDISGKKITHIIHDFGKFEVFDPVEVEDHNTYFSNDVVSHNTDFLGSADTLISPMKLRNLAWVQPNKNGWGVDIYEEPIKDHIYTITVDTSHGVALDASAFAVIDVTNLPYKLVAKFKDHNTSPMMYPEIIAKTGWDYNTAYVLCETNDVGMVVAESLHRDLEYENILTTITKGRQGQRVGGGFGTARPMMGVKMTKSVKHVGCANIKDVIEGDKLVIQDYDIIQELSTFIAKGSSYEADDGCHDDLVMSLVLFGWLVRQQMFKDLSNNDVRLKLAQERYADVYEDLMPAGFIDTGMGDEYIESIDPNGAGFVDPFRF